jgi:hypothetical protein
MNRRKTTRSINNGGKTEKLRTSEVQLVLGGGVETDSDVIGYEKNIPTEETGLGTHN